MKTLHRSAFFRSTSLYTAGNLAEAAIPLALLPVMTRFLTPSEYGQVAMFLAVVSALSAVVGLNSSGAASRRYFDADPQTDDLPQYIGACVVILLCSAVAALLPLFYFREQVSDWLDIPTSWVLLALLTATLTFVAALRLGQWMVRERAGALVTLQLTRAALNAGISLLLVAWLLWAAEGRVIGHFIATFVVALIAAYSLFRDRLVRFDFNSEQVWDALRFGVPLIPHVAGMFLLGAVDRIVINDRLGLAEVGVYTVAAQLAMGLSLLFAAINKAYVPWLYSRLKRDSEDEKREIVRLTYLYFVGCLILAGAVWLIGPTIAALLAGPQYAEAGAVIGWLALGQAFFGMYLMVTNYIFYSKRTGALAATTLVSGMINVLVMVMLTGFLGVKGAAIAFAFALFLRFLMTWAVAARRHPMPWLAPNWAQMMVR